MQIDSVAKTVNTGTAHRYKDEPNCLNELNIICADTATQPSPNRVVLVMG